MLPTLRELLELSAFKGVLVLSGQLEARVTWVHVSEVMDGHRFLSGGELLLSTGLELAGASVEARGQYVRDLAQSGASGLALELVRNLRDVPPEMLGAARMLNFPILAFPHEVRFADLTRAAHERILRPHASPGDGSLAPVLAALVETGRAESFVKAHLGPLLTLPSRPRATLLATLDFLLRHHMNVAEVARQLGVRRQTIYYRLDQITGMLGDVGEARRSVALALALQLCRDGAVELDRIGHSVS